MATKYSLEIQDTPEQIWSSDENGSPTEQNLANYMYKYLQKPCETNSCTNPQWARILDKKRDIIVTLWKP